MMRSGSRMRPVAPLMRSSLIRGSPASSSAFHLPILGSISLRSSPAPLHSLTAAGPISLRRGYAAANESLLGGDKNDIFSRAYQEVKQKEEERGERPRTTEVKSQTKNLPASIKRVDHLLRQIRRLSYNEAIIQLKFSQKRIAKNIIEAIEKARYIAETKHGLDPARLLLDEIYATKGQYGSPRIDYKAKGRIGIMRRKKVHLTVKLKEVPYQEGEKGVGKFVRGGSAAERKAFIEKRDRVAKEMGLHPLVITTQQVELWDLYKEKVLNKRKSASAPSADETPAPAAEKKQDAPPA